VSLISTHDKMNMRQFNVIRFVNYFGKLLVFCGYSWFQMKKKLDTEKIEILLKVTFNILKYKYQGQYYTNTAFSWEMYIDWGRSLRSIYIFRSIYNLYRLNRKAVFFILLIDNFTVIWFVQCPSHIFYIINCHAKHETEDLQMDIHPRLGVLATGN
jgi:hypothetical protein